MAQPERPLSPFMHYRWQYTNTLSILHRLTGVLLSFVFLLLVYWLVAIAGGPETYAEAQSNLGSPLAQLVLLGGIVSFCYHLLNGIRHLFFDFGRGFELRTARTSGRAVAIGAVVAGLTFWWLIRHSLGGGL